MSLLKTDLRNTREGARSLRNEPSGGVSATDVQGAINELDGTISAFAGAAAIRRVTDAGDIDVTNDDGVVIVAKAVGAATQVNLDPAATFNHPIQVVDGKLDAAVNNITIVPDAVDVNGLDGLATLTINTNGGGFRLIPTELGWKIG